jgi:hypothetical protein
MARRSSLIVFAVFSTTNTETYKKSIEKIKILFKTHLITYSKKLLDFYVELS